MTARRFGYVPSLMHIPKHDIHVFLAESNKIEGINDWPTDTQVEAAEAFIIMDEITADVILKFTRAFQPDARLRFRKGLDVRVGTHKPPPGGPVVQKEMERILRRAQKGEHPYFVHHAYETLHPLTDGNGRSGRILWAWGMLRFGHSHRLKLGFLHAFYYQALQFARIK